MDLMAENLTQSIFSYKRKSKRANIFAITIYKYKCTVNPKLLSFV